MTTTAQPDVLQRCECPFSTHKDKGCGSINCATRCAGCGRALCASCTIDGERCAPCYREVHGVRPAQVGGQVRKHPQWKWTGQ